MSEETGPGGPAGRKETASYGANTAAGNLGTLSKTSWWEIRGKVMAAVKDALLECLAPKHHDHWEFVAHKSFQLGAKKATKFKSASDDENVLFPLEDSTRHKEVLKRVARMYLMSKEEGAPQKQLHGICSLVSSTTSLEEWNELLKAEHMSMLREAAALALTLQQQQEQEQEEEEKEKQTRQATDGQLDPSPSAPSSSGVALQCEEEDSSALSSGLSSSHDLLLPLPPPPPAAGTSTTLPPPSPSHQQQARPDEQKQAQSSPKVKVKSSPKDPIPMPLSLSNTCPRVTWRAWAHSKEESTPVLASASRLLDRENERRCKAYDSNKAISTAIRLCEEESSGAGKTKSSSSSEGLLSTLDPVAQCVENRLGYSSAKIFAEKLDIMQKIIKAYQYPENTTEEKDFLLGLVSGSFTRDEINKILMPAEAQILAPGRLRNTALISGHKWTYIRKAAACPTMNLRLEPPEKCEEGAKKRKRATEQHTLATSAAGAASAGVSVDEDTSGGARVKGKARTTATATRSNIRGGGGSGDSNTTHSSSSNSASVPSPSFALPASSSSSSGSDVVFLAHTTAQQISQSARI